jgi:RNA 3'-terminal phosphate cyclase (ATP)
MIDVDGAHGEGGGQLLRMAVALSAVTQKPVHVSHVRAGRSKPGLAAQHVVAVGAVSDLCSGKVSGLEVGSSEITFWPGAVQAGGYSWDVGTAGSVALVFQALLPVAAAARGPVRVRIIGGTDVPWSPPMDYVSRVFLPLVRRLGAHVDVEVPRRGYYPRGGGIFEAVVEPTRSWSPFRVTSRDPIERIRGIAHVSNLPEDIPKRMKHAAIRRLHGAKDVKVEERLYSGDEAIGPGGALVLWAQTHETLLGADSLARRGKPSERVGEEAASSLMAEIDSGATLDVHAADQLLVYLARADGPSEFRVREVTGHLETLMWLLPQFLPVHFRVVREVVGSQVTVVPGA